MCVHIHNLSIVQLSRSRGSETSAEPSQVALRLLRADPAVLRCYPRLQLTMYYSELGASAAVLAAGYNIDSLMLRCCSPWQLGSGSIPEGLVMHLGRDRCESHPALLAAAQKLADWYTSLTEFACCS